VEELVVSGKIIANQSINQSIGRQGLTTVKLYRRMIPSPDLYTGYASGAEK
jgi:hypothetical protein